MQLFPATSSDSSVEQVRREISGGSQERMRRELADALEEMGRSFSLCLALEDLHWSDLATTEQIAYLSNRIGTQRVLIVGTYRPTDLMAASHPLRPILLDMQGRGVALELSLELLNREDVAAYIDLEFPGHRFPPDFPAWIYSKTEGSPLFMVDLLRYLTERQAIVEGTRWELLKPIATLEGETPISVRSMIERMIETLSEEQRKCLTVASVQGDTFDSLVQSEVTGVDELRLEEQLEVLHRVHRLVEPSGELEFPDGSLTVRHKFVHVLYQEALYQALTAKRKMLLHARVGETLEKHYAMRTRMAAAELALHFDRARRTDRALPYYLQAARNAVAKFAHVQAEGYCTRGLELADRMEGAKRDRERLPILKERGNTRFVMSRFDAAIADFQEMLASAERMNDFEAEANARCFLAEAFFMSKQNERLVEQVVRVLELADRHELTEAAAQGRMLLGLQRMCYGQMDEGGKMLLEGERLSRELTTGTTRSRALAWTSQFWFFQSDYERVLAQHKRLEAVAIERHDGFSLLICYLFGGLTHVNYGHLAEGVRTLEHGRKTAENNNDLFWLGRFPNCLAWTYHEAFDFPGALARKAAEIARQTGFLEGEANSLLNVGLAHVQLGDYDSARQQFEVVEKISKVDEPVKPFKNVTLRFFVEPFRK
jgi:tetratricopeptide (TPR) repeat protein